MSKAISTSVDKRVDAEKLNLIARSILLGAIGFMIGRGVIEGFSPMLVAYYCAIYPNKKVRIWGFLAIVLGFTSIASITNIFKYLSILSALSVLIPIMEAFYHKRLHYILAVAGGVITFVIGIGYHWFFSSYQVGVGATALEALSVVFLTVLFEKGIGFISGEIETQSYNKETFISLAIMACFATMGILGIQMIQLSLLQLLALNIILYVGYQFGLEASSILGIAIGFGAFYSDSGGTIEYFMIWSILGVVAGLFRELGKIGTALAYCIAYLSMTLVFMPSGIEIKTVEVLFVTVILFLILPLKVKQKRVYEEIAVDESEIQKLVHHKLERFAQTYENIAKKFIHMKPLQERLTNNEINQLIDHVAEKVCKDCSLCNMCWQKDFYDTYKAVYSVLSAVENKGEVNVEDIPEDFYKHCLKVDEFVIMVNRIFEMYKNNLKWENKIVEHRALFADQFLSVSQIIKDLSNNITDNKQAYVEFVNKLKKEFDRNRLDVLGVQMQCYTNERKEIEVEINAGKDQDFIKELLKTINKMGPNKFQTMEVLFDENKNVKYCIFTEKENFKLVKGYAKTNKDFQNVSGDSFTFLGLNSGKDIIALSDGMGSGEKAFEESKATIEILEQLVEGGFDINVAIKTVNTILGIRNDNQAFATLDISMVDRFTGECTFIKNGAVSTFLKRGNNVERIKTDTLPLGMFKEVESQSIKKRLKSDDLVIMMSDGISDIVVNDDEKAVWLEDIISNLDSLNPQKIADTILDMAKEKSEGSANDDMTVLVFRVWERIAG